MADLYRVQVYYNSTNDFANATFLQHSYYTINNYNFRSLGYGAIVDSNGNLTTRGQEYNENGFFNTAFIYFYRSSIDNSLIIDRCLSLFQYYLACGVDIDATGLLNGYFFITTPNSDYYAVLDFSTTNNKTNVFGGILYKKSDNTQVSGKSITFTYLGYYHGSAPASATDWAYLYVFYEYSPSILGYLDANSSYSSSYAGRCRIGVNTTGSVTLPQGNVMLVANDEPYEPTNDPYADAGDSTTGGGGGTFDGTSDPVPVPNLPSVGAQDSGFITLFVPTVQQMKNLAHYMWVNPLFDVTTGFKKLFSDPMDCILGLSVVPVSIPTTGPQNVNIGNLVTSVSMNVASQQYIEVDCGTIDFTARYFGSYLDFEPYTKMAIFLPYCGTHQISADEVMGKIIGVTYHIDILTGSCVAFVKCDDSVLYEFNGACGSNIPVNSLNFASTIENTIRIATNIGTTVATAGAAAPAATASEAALAANKAANAGRMVSLAGSTAEGALSLKPNVSRSGALGGTVGILGHQVPYMIITRPRLCKPKKQDFFQGYPSFIQTTIGDLIGKGFSSFTNVLIAGQYLTDEEEEELESILESGVYL